MPTDGPPIITERQEPNLTLITYIRRLVQLIRQQRSMNDTMYWVTTALRQVFDLYPILEPDDGIAGLMNMRLDLALNGMLQMWIRNLEILIQMPHYRDFSVVTNETNMRYSELFDSF